MVNELYRQGIHLLVGLVAALTAATLPRTTFLFLWGVVFLLALITVIISPSPLAPVWRILERGDAAFRGKGGLFFLGGVWLVGAVFWEHAALSIVLLTIPDALATVLAPFVTSPALLWNHRKSLFGSGVFFVSALLILASTRPFIAGLLLAFFLAALESFDYRDIPFLDDNLVIPLVAGFFLGLL